MTKITPTERAETEELSPLESSILYELWKDENVLEDGLTIDQLRRRLRYKTRDMVDDAIHSLIGRAKRERKWQTIRLVKGVRSGGKGRTPGAYRLVNMGIVKWPETAFLLLELACFDQTRRWQVNTAQFYKHLIENCGFSSLEEIYASVEYAWEWCYLLKDQENKRDYHTIWIGDRARCEKDYLKRIARHYPEELAREQKTLKASYYKISKGL